MLLLILRVIRDVRRKFPTRLRLEAGAQVKNKETDIPWRILQWPMESSDSPYVMINGIYSSLNRSRSPDLVDCNPGREAVTRLEREARLTDWYFMQSCTSPVWASPIYRGGQKYDHHRSNNTWTSRVSKAQIHQIWSLAYHLQLSSREWKASLNICSIAGQNNLVFAWKNNQMKFDSKALLRDTVILLFVILWSQINKQFHMHSRLPPRSRPKVLIQRTL